MSKDPIAALEKRLSGSHGGGVWSNGAFPAIKLKRHAKPKDIVKQLKKDNEFQIIKEGHVKIDQVDYEAVLISTDGQKSIVLMNYIDDSTGWWTKEFPQE